MAPEVRGSPGRPSYFFVSVSTRENLDLCVKHALAGFLGGESGAWTFCEIADGDFVSFLYGARAHNLYRVAGREAIRDSGTLPPWKPLTFKESGKSYSFPFRLYLEPIRTFDEPIVRAEFYYVAENLLLRGGYRKTHFQADQTTLQSVSEMGARATAPAVPLSLPQHRTFTPRFTRNASLVSTPETTRFRETILQSAIRRHLSVEVALQKLLDDLNLTSARADELEVLGEKALAQGYIDILVKQRVPLGSGLRIPIEVKTQRALPKDLAQLQDYVQELGDDCPAGVLVAASFSKRALDMAGKGPFRLVRYGLSVDLQGSPTFPDICDGLVLEAVRC
jgi:hypothetical protein